MSKLSLKKESLQILSGQKAAGVAGATGWGMECIRYKDSVYCPSGLADYADNCITLKGCPETTDL